MKGDLDRLAYDENNLMKGIVVDDVHLQHYIYDAGGSRIVKSTGGIEQVNIDGQTSVDTSYLNSSTIYPNGYITISPTGRYTKHYYIGTERIMSRMMGVLSKNYLGSDGGARTRQFHDLKELSTQLGIKSIGVFPTEEIVDDCSQYVAGSEAQKQCECEQDPENCASDVMYFFHSDHLGSTSLLTDSDGEPYQFLLYLPWGESMVEQKVASYSTPYQFNGKELDSETGLYNYGARYYDPSLSIWLGVDPLADAPANIGTSPYTYVWNNPLRFVDPDGRHGEDWVQRGNGEIYWDDNATSQATTQAGETYLGDGGFATVSSSGLQTNYNSDKSFDHYNTNDNVLPEVTVTGTPSSNALATTSDGVGGLGVGMIAQGGSMRLTNGSANGNSLSLKHYQSGWNGGSRAGIRTFQLGTAGKFVSRAGTAGTVIIGGVDVAYTGYQEGGFGTYTQQATGRFAGSLGGAWLGAKGGAAVGVWVGGWGAIPGAIIGGIGGGFGGSYLGGKGVQKVQQLKKP